MGQSIPQPYPEAKEHAMRKTVLVPLMVLAVSVFAVSVFVVTGMSQAKMHEKMMDKHGKMDDVKLHVKLTGIPDVKTAAKGKATFTMAKDGSSIHYKLHMEKIENVTMSHIHAIGEGGKPGPVIAWLYPSTGGGPSLKEGKFSGSLAEGDITPDKFAGDWKGKPVKDLFAGIAHGEAGVAVHTKQNPGTELWGVYKHAGMEHMGKEHMGKEHMGKKHMGKEHMEKEHGERYYPGEKSY
jgi:hypothetical protein